MIIFIQILISSTNQYQLKQFLKNVILHKVTFNNTKSISLNINILRIQLK